MPCYNCGAESGEIKYVNLGATGPEGPQGPPGAPGPTDHGALTGRADNDHPQYALLNSNPVFTGAVEGSRLRGNVSLGGLNGISFYQPANATTLAVNAIANLGSNRFGLMVIINSSSGNTALFFVKGLVSMLVAQMGGFSATYNSAGTLNVASNGTDLVIQNKLALAASVHVHFFTFSTAGPT